MEVARSARGVRAGRGRGGGGVPGPDEACRPGVDREAACASQVVDDGCERPPLDELHGVVMHAAVAADGEDRHEVRVVEVRRRLGLDLEPLDPPRVDRGGEREDLQRDPAAERDLLGLVDDPHPAPAQLADDPEVAQPRGRDHRRLVLDAGGFIERE